MEEYVNIPKLSIISVTITASLGFLGGSVVKNSPANPGDTRDAGSIPRLGKSPGGGNGNALQYSCPENPMDRAAWWATVHQVAKSQTGLKRLNTHSTYERMANLTQKGEIQGMCVCGG